MRGRLSVALLLAFAAVSSADDDKGAGEKPATVEKMIATGSLIGQVVSVNPETREIRLKVGVSLAVPGASHAQTRTNLGRAAQIQDPTRRQNRLKDLGRTAKQRAAGSFRTVSQTVTLQAADDVKVRLTQPPRTYDEKGNFKRLTKEEANKLKGPGRMLPGYAADFTNLVKGQLVRVTLVKKQAKPQPTGKDKQDAADKPIVGMIVVLKSADP